MAGSKTGEKSSQVLFCAGEDTNRDLLLQAYDIQNDEWSPEITITREKYNDGIPFDNKFYITNVVDHCNDKCELEIRSYDLLTKEKETKKYPVDDFVGLPVGTHGNSIYFVNTVSRKVSRFNAKDNTVEENLATLRECHYREGTAFLNDRLYNLGVVYANYDQNSECEIFDTITNEVKPIAPYPADAFNRTKSFPRISATAFDGKLYSMEEHTLRYVYVYSPEKDEWETITNKYPPAINNGQLVTCGGKLICMDRIMHVHLYDLETNSWESRTDYNGGMSFMKSVAVIAKAN